MIPSPRWTPEELDAQRRKAIALFRVERLQEPVEAYSSALEAYQGVMEDLLEATVDLRKLDDDGLAQILTDARNLEAFRYLSGPPVSEDDLQTLAEAASLSPRRLKADRETLTRMVGVVISCIDRRRFPWFSEQRDPTESERKAAVLASACLMAYQRIQTERRNTGKRLQEVKVKEALIEAGFAAVSTRPIPVLECSPGVGEFCGEAPFGNRKADFVIGLWDRRKLPIECKVSNSELNSVKRLNNDAAAKAEAWIKDFGARNVVPVAVLSGVYKLANLIEAQDRGLTLFWAHELQALKDWLAEIRRIAGR